MSQLTKWLRSADPVTHAFRQGSGLGDSWASVCGRYEVEAPTTVNHEGRCVACIKRMGRGAIRPTSIREAVERARSMLGYRPANKRQIAYRLKGGFNGGHDPFAKHPARWSPADSQREAWSKTGAYTCDCAGFVAWCLGYDRYQPDSGFHNEGRGYKYINTDSAIWASEAEVPTWFKRLEYPEVGCLVVYGSKWRSGKRVRVGHVGLVTAVPAEWDPENPQFDLLKVIHCSSGNQRRFGASIQETDGSIWAKRGLFLRYLRAA